MSDPRTDVLRMLAQRAAHPKCTDGSTYWYDDWERDRFMEEADLIDAFVAWGEAVRKKEWLRCNDCDDGREEIYEGAWIECETCKGSGLR